MSDNNDSRMPRSVWTVMEYARGTVLFDESPMNPGRLIPVNNSVRCNCSFQEFSYSPWHLSARRSTLSSDNSSSQNALNCP